MPARTSELVAAIRAAFPADETARILAALDAYGGAPGEREKERVQLAIVELSAGSKERLLFLLRAAKLDYRDVLAWRQSGALPAAAGERLRAEARALIARWGKK